MAEITAEPSKIEHWVGSIEMKSDDERKETEVVELMRSLLRSFGNWTVTKTQDGARRNAFYFEKEFTEGDKNTAQISWNTVIGYAKVISTQLM